MLAVTMKAFHQQSAPNSDNYENESLQDSQAPLPYTQSGVCGPKLSPKACKDCQGSVWKGIGQGRDYKAIEK